MICLKSEVRLVMSLKYPVPVLEIFHFYDIPERFFTERCNAAYFDKLCERLVDFDQVDPADAFAMPHLHDRYHVMLNYFCHGIMWNPERFSGIGGQHLIRDGIFAILYSYWDYKFDDPNIGIESGLNRFKEYQKKSILKEISFEERYICDWIKERIDVNKVCWLLENLKYPWKDDFEGIDPLEVEVLHLIRDAMTYGPLYCMSYYPKELQEIQNYSLALTLITQYGVETIDEINNCFNTYFRSPLRHEPYTEFTRKMIEIYNGSRINEENILNEDSISDMSRYLDTHSGELEFNLIKARNPLSINEQMIIY